jgi:hypothetical protein
VADPQNRLTIRRIVHDVGQSYAHRFGRVVMAAALVFGLSATIGVAIERLLDIAEENVLIYLFALAGSTMSQFGITFYAGLLDKVVGEFELGEPPEPVGQVLRTLPYGRLLVADLLITLAAIVGAAFFVIPGVILFTLFSLAGPIVNIEHRGPIDAMRRSAQLVRPHFWFVLFFVAVPVGLEHQVIHVVHDLYVREALIEIFIVQGITGMIVGSFVGLVEVNIAYALVAADRAGKTASADR